MTDKLKNFKLSTIFDTNVFITIYGKHSHNLIKYLIRSNTTSKFQKIIIFTDKKDYNSLLSQKISISPYNKNQLKKIINAQILKSKELLIIFDLSTYENIFFRSASIKQLHSNSRDSNISCILSTPTYLMPPIICVNSDYIFIFRQNCLSRNYYLYNYYGSLIKNRETFYKMLTVNINTNYKCLVIDNITQSKDTYKYCDIEKLILKKCINHWIKYVKYKKRKRINNSIIKIAFLPPNISRLKVLVDGGPIYKETMRNWQQKLAEEQM